MSFVMDIEHRLMVPGKRDSIDRFDDVHEPDSPGYESAECSFIKSGLGTVVCISSAPVTQENGEAANAEDNFGDQTFYHHSVDRHRRAPFFDTVLCG